MKKNLELILPYLGLILFAYFWYEMRDFDFSGETLIHRIMILVPAVLGPIGCIALIIRRFRRKK